MEKEYLYKIRSFSSCFLAAYKLLRENAKGIFRCTWLPMLLFGVSSGLFMTLNLRNSDISTMAMEHGYLYLALWGLSFIGIVVGAVWAMARLLSMLNGEKRRWNAIRLILVSIFNFIIVGILSAIVAGAFYLWMRHSGGTLQETLQDNWLVILAVSLAFILMLLPFYYITIRYLFDRETRFVPALPKNYMTGLRHFGFIFITFLLLCLITGVIFLFVSLPFLVLVLAHTASTLGVLMGDPSGMPSSFIWLHGGTYALTTILMGYVSMFSLLVWLFVYGSIQKQREERKTTLIPTNNDSPFIDFEE